MKGEARGVHICTRKCVPASRSGWTRRVRGARASPTPTPAGGCPAAGLCLRLRPRRCPCRCPRCRGRGRGRPPPPSTTDGSPCGCRRRPRPRPPLSRPGRPARLPRRPRPRAPARESGRGEGGRETGEKPREQYNVGSVRAGSDRSNAGGRKKGGHCTCTTRATDARMRRPLRGRPAASPPSPAPPSAASPSASWPCRMASSCSTSISNMCSMPPAMLMPSSKPCVIARDRERESVVGEYRWVRERGRERCTGSVEKGLGTCMMAS